MPHVDIELEDNKQFISNIPRIEKVASVAESDVRLTCDQVEDSIPTGSGNIFIEIDHEIFYTGIPSLPPDSRRTVDSF